MRGAEFDGDFLFGGDGRFVEEGGFVAPLADGGDGGGQEGGRAAEELDIGGAALRRDGGVDFHHFH